eukprot:5021769-Prymnesium_polylepis.1
MGFDSWIITCVGIVSVAHDSDWKSLRASARYRRATGPPESGGAGHGARRRLLLLKCARYRLRAISRH